MDSLDGIVEEFLVESHENLDSLDRDLVQLEATPDSRELLASVFRTIHTIKGTSGFLAFGALEQLTHVGENLLARLRDGELVLTPARTDVLLEMVDVVRVLLEVIERTGKDDGVDVSATVNRIESALSVSLPEVGAEADTVTDGAAEADTVTRAGAEADIATAVEAEADAVGGAYVLPASEAAPPVAAEADVDSGEGRRSAVDSSIRVDVAVLDSLMRLVGELVLARNQILQRAVSLGDNNAIRAAHRLDLISGELQEGVMKTRMQSMDYLWSKLPRMVRDLSAQCGKQVNLVMDGRDTELDRTLLDAVKDPLTHLVRNAVDHGIESPDVRKAAGKPAVGTLRLRAYHASGQVVMEIIDDGCGIDTGKVAAKAVERGLITAAEAGAASESDLIDLVFRPGFSTAAAVTNVSGRGVGMDVVRTNIERVGGSVELTSEAGKGSVVRVTIPLTLAIIPALVVRQGGQRYAIPQVQLVELVRMDPEDPTRGIEYVAGCPVHRLRGTLLPLLDLSSVLQMTGPEDTAATATGTDGAERRMRTVAVLRGDNTEFGVVIHEVLDTQEIVVKPLGTALAGIGVFAGAAVMGDGLVALILDVPGLSVQGRIAATVAAIADRPAADVASEGTGGDSFVVARSGTDTWCAVPLASVDRLEEAKRSAFEHLGDMVVMQYHGDLLPIVDLTGGQGDAGFGGEYRLPSQGGAPEAESYSADPTAPVIVCRTAGRPVGLRVLAVVDIVRVDLHASGLGERPGSLGSIVVHGRVVDVLDIAHHPYVQEMLVV